MKLNLYSFYLEIPQGVTKCCSACFNRISRRLAPHLPPSGTAAGSPGAAWGEEERTKLRTLLSEHGAHWALISERLGRPIHQVSMQYFLCEDGVSSPLTIMS